MTKFCRVAVVFGLGTMALGTVGVSRACAQDPILTPVIINEVVPMVIDEAKPIVVKLAPKPKPTGLEKYEGYIVHANTAQVTVRAKGNDLGIETFALNQNVSAKMQKIVDNGGYQYGDKVTVYYDPTSRVVMKIKGKPSRPL